MRNWLYLDRYGEAPTNSSVKGGSRAGNESTARAVPVGLPAAAYDGLQYGAIVYGRGPLRERPRRSAHGPGDVRSLPEEYGDRHRWGIATTASFEEMAEAACDCSLDDLFSEWLAP